MKRPVVFVSRGGPFYRTLTAALKDHSDAPTVCEICMLLANPLAVARAGMLAPLLHRRPNASRELEAVARDGAAWFDSKRLAILTLDASGHQPQRTVGGRMMITCNGAIRHYAEIRSAPIGRWDRHE